MRERMNNGLHADLVLYRRALREHWPIPEDVRAAMMAKVSCLALLHPDPDINLKALLVALKAEQQSLDRHKYQLAEQAAQDLEIIKEAQRGVQPGLTSPHPHADPPPGTPPPPE